MTWEEEQGWGQAAGGWGAQALEDLDEKVSEKVCKRCPKERGAEALASRPAEHKSMGWHRAQHSGTVTPSPLIESTSHGEGAESMSPARMRRAWGQAGPDRPRAAPWNPQPQTQYLAPRWLSCRKQLHRPALDLKERNTTLVTGRTRWAGQGLLSSLLPLGSNPHSACEWGALSMGGWS